MKVSVALCTYNGERWIEAFLESLHRQTTPPDELVVSDDGSLDGTLALVRAFAETATFPVRVSSAPEHLGSTFNFERAFALCAGDLIAPADQDDLWAPTKLERLRAAMMAGGPAMAFSNGWVIDDDGDPVDVMLWEGVGFDRADRLRFERDPLAVLVRRSVVTGAAMMFRADQLDRLLPFPSVLNAHVAPMLHDRWIALVLAAVDEVVAVAEPLISFRQHAAQQTGLRSPLSLREVARQLRRTSQASGAVSSARAEQLEAVMARLRGGARPGADRLLADAVDHLRTRARLPAPRTRRAPTVAAEWKAGGYRRFSGGGRSALTDLVRPTGR